MLPIKEQTSSVYRNKDSLTFLPVRVDRGFMCFSGKRRKYSCFAGNNSLFYVLFSLTVIALTWKLSWHFVGNKHIKRMLLAGSFTNLAPGLQSLAEAPATWLQTRVLLCPIETQGQSHASEVLGSIIPSMEPPIPLWERKNHANWSKSWVAWFLRERNRWKPDYCKVKMYRFMLITLTRSLIIFVCTQS